MPDRIARERAFDLNQAASNAYSAAVAAAANAYAAAKDKAYGQRDRAFDELRDRRTLPRTGKIAAQIAATEQKMRDPLPEPDLSAAEGKRDRANVAADRLLDVALKDIRRRLAAGKLDE